MEIKIDQAPVITLPPAATATTAPAATATVTATTPTSTSALTQFVSAEDGDLKWVVRCSKPVGDTVTCSGTVENTDATPGNFLFASSYDGHGYAISDQHDRSAIQYSQEAVDGEVNGQSELPIGEPTKFSVSFKTASRDATKWHLDLHFRWRYNNGFVDIKDVPVS
jgi:hypothetical protein